MPSHIPVSDVLVDLCRCALAGVTKAEPNWLADQAVRSGTPRPDIVQIHPAFFGCYDWHSAVHSHWLLARLLASGLLKEELAARVEASS